MESTDLTKLRVSGDDALKEVVKVRAKLAETQRELAAVKRDRDETLQEYTDLQASRYPAKSAAPKPSKVKKSTIRVICNDMHGSHMDRPAVDAFLNDLTKWKPDEIVMNGDMIDCGGFLAAHHTIGYVAESAYTYQDDIAAGNWFLDEVQTRCPKAVIHYTEGNHESRVERYVMDQRISNKRDAVFLAELLAPSTLLRLAQRGIQYYRRSEVHLADHPPGWIKLGKIYFVHELGTSKNAASAAVTATAGNVVYAHTHRADTSTTILPGAGLIAAWNPGCLCQRTPLYRHSNPTGWSHGYAVQFVESDGDFLHLNIPIWNGKSLAGNMHGRIAA